MEKIPVTYNLYADVIFFNNFIMNFFLLTALRKILKLRKRRGGLWAAAMFGGAYAVAVSIFMLPVWLQALLTYVCVSTLMVMIAFKVRDGKEALKCVAGLYLTAALAAGIFNLFPAGAGPAWYVERLFFGGGFGRLSFSVYLLLGCGSFFLICYLWQAVKAAENRNSHLCRVVLFYQGKEELMTGFLDTGNMLREPYSGKPVSIIAPDCAKVLFGEAKAFLYVPYCSVGEEAGLLPALKADRIKIERDGRCVVVEQPFIGISPGPLSQRNEYQMLLNEEMWI